MEAKLNEKKAEPQSPQRSADRASGHAIEAFTPFSFDDPAALTPQSILALQRFAGNAAIAELMEQRSQTRRPAAPDTEDSTDTASSEDLAGGAFGGLGGLIGGVAGGGAGGAAAGATGGALGGMLGGVAGGAGGAAGAIGAAAGAAGGALGGLLGGGSGGIAGGAGAGSGGALGGMLGGVGGAAGAAGGAPPGAMGGVFGGAQSAGGIGGAVSGAAGAAGAAAGMVGGALGGLFGGLGGALGGMLGGMGSALGGTFGGPVGGILGGLAGAGGFLGGLFGQGQPAAPGHQATPAHPATPARPHPTPVHEAHRPAPRRPPAPRPHHAVAAAPGSWAFTPPAKAKTPEAPPPKAPETAAARPVPVAAPDGQAGAGGTSPGAPSAGGHDLDAAPPLGETIPEIPEPPVPNVVAIGQVGHTPGHPTAPGLQPPGTPPPPHQATGIEQTAHGIEGAAHGGGGLMDMIIQGAMSLLQGIVGGVAGTARSTAGTVGSRASGDAERMHSTAASEGQAAHNQVQSEATSTTTESKAHVGQAHEQAKHAVGEAATQAKGAPAQTAGAMGDLVGLVLAGAPAIPTFTSPFTRLFTQIIGRLPGLLTGALSRVQAFVDQRLNRLTATINAVSQGLIAAITRVAAVARGAMDWIAQQLTALRTAASRGLSGLPSIVRGALQPIVDAVLGAVTRAVQGMLTITRLVVESTLASARFWLEMTARMLTATIAIVRRLVDVMLASLRRMIQAAVAALAALRRYLINAAMAFISRALRFVIEPIYRRAYQHLMELIGPQLKKATEQARLRFPNGMPPPPQVQAAVLQAAAQADGNLDSIKKGLVNPEGDHLTIGIQIGGSAAGGVGGSGGVGVNLEVVYDYRNNDIGIFLSPAAGAQLNLGELGATGNVTGMAGWGTVGSFGDPNKDVIESWSGTFVNVGGGVQAGLAEGGGATISTGGQLYRGLPDAPTPTPGYPARSDVVEVGQVRFRTQKSDAEAEPNGPQAMEAAVTAIREIPTKQQGAKVTQVGVEGQASRIWLHPRAGKSREAENAELAGARANSVKAGLTGRLGGTPPVTGTGTGDKKAKAAGLPETDHSPEYRRAVVRALVDIPAVPEGETEGFLPNLVHGRAAWGWDTTASFAGHTGAKVGAGVYGGAGVSYSIPLSKARFDAETMNMIRIQVGITKILADIMTASPLSLLRDVWALWHGKVAPDTKPALTNAVTKWTVPMPPGVAVA